MKSIARIAIGTALLGLLATAVAAPALAADDETLTEIIDILRQQGLIDDDQHAELAAKAQRRQQQGEESWADRIELWGDFRARAEAFDFDEGVFANSAGTRVRNRFRARYRGRLYVRGKVASRASVVLGLASGDADPRSTNQTLGSGLFFDTDDLRLDLAYATLSPFPDAELPGVENGYLGLDLGKVKNPFTSKDFGYDSLLWDGDIRLEGAQLRFEGDAGPLSLFANAGGYVIDENGSSKDPALVAEQLGASIEVVEHVEVGARGTAYHFLSLDQPFFNLAAANPGGPGGTGGNVLDGLSRRTQDIHVVETAGFVALEFWELFPVLFYGSYAKNLSAESSLTFPGVGREDYAWSAGGYVGDKKQLVRIGLGYFYMRANAFPSMFIDSDILDGVPNREGWALTLDRELFPGVELALSGFATKRIKGGFEYANSALRADRLRGRADLNFKF